MLYVIPTIRTKFTKYSQKWEGDQNVSLQKKRKGKE